MKAIAISEFGGIEQLHKMELEKPKIDANEVLVKVNYTAVNPVDWKIREGYLKDRLPHKFPIVLGWDASGVVSEVGKNVKSFKVGDEVFAYCRKPTVQWGTYAEYIALDASSVAHKPKNINFAQAAAIPLVGLTAWQALFDAAKLKKGDTILIHAGAGGVGSLAIQFAKHIGAHVLTTASPANHDYVINLGADSALDYTKDYVGQVKQMYPKGIDVIFDCIGGKTAHESIPLLKSQGYFVSIVEKMKAEDAAQHDIQSSYVFVSPNGKELAEIATLISENKVKVPNIIEMTLDDVAKAHGMSQTHHVNGKIVLKV